MYSGVLISLIQARGEGEMWGTINTIARGENSSADANKKVE